MLERETRIELATNSLEGCDSTIELLPLAVLSAMIAIPAAQEQVAALRIMNTSALHLSELPHPEVFHLHFRGGDPQRNFITRAICRRTHREDATW